jgi:hypothetical protein
MKELDIALKELFRCKDHLFIGFGFKSDLDKLKQRLPDMEFYTEIPRFIDL